MIVKIFKKRTYINKIKNKLSLLFCIFLSTILLTGCLIENKPSEKGALKELDEFLDEPYQIVSETHDDKDIYELYLPDSNITVHLTGEYEYNDAVNKQYFLDIADYYQTKFLSLTDARAKLREERYPAIHEEITFWEYSNNSKDIDTVNISIDSEDDLQELYNYLIECYKLNDFKYYNAYMKNKDKFESLYWNDFIGIELFCSNEERAFLYFSDLRKEEFCLPKDLNKMITYEEFIKKYGTDDKRKNISLKCNENFLSGTFTDNFNCIFTKQNLIEEKHLRI